MQLASGMLTAVPKGWKEGITSFCLIVKISCSLEYFADDSLPGA